MSAGSAPSQTLRARLQTYVREYVFLLGDGWRAMPVVAGLMLLQMALDVVGVGMVAPLAGFIVTSNVPSALSEYAARPRLAFLLFGVAIVAVFIVKAILSYYLSRRVILFAEGRRAALMDRLIGAYQALDWQLFVARSSPAMINYAYTYTEHYSSGTLTASLNFATNLLVSGALILLLAMRDPVAILVVVGCLGIYFVILYRPLRLAQTEAQKSYVDDVHSMLHNVSQALGAMREVHAMGRADFFRRKVREAAQRLARDQARASALGQVPRYGAEATMMLVIVIVAGMRFAAEGAAVDAVPTLALFAAVGVRLMPAVTSIVSTLSTLRATRFVVSALAAELAEARVAPAGARPAATGAATAAHDGFAEFRELRLDAVTFAYAAAPARPILQEVSFAVHRGETIGLMGRSGSGKSTLADVILGLLLPQAGSVQVNGRDIHDSLPSWRRLLGYIPQSPYLLDESVSANIAFGVEEGEADPARLAYAIDRAQLREVVDRLPQGLDTRIGEGGVLLSGGQRQRLAIARALYQGRQFLILDEATSALDEETERDVLAAVRSLHGTMTILIIAHSERTLAACDRIERLGPARMGGGS